MYIHFKEKKVYILTHSMQFQCIFGLRNQCMMAAANRTAFSPRFAANDCVQYGHQMDGTSTKTGAFKLYDDWAIK